MDSTFYQRIEAFTVKRIHKEIQEFQEDPIPWISICMPDHENPFLLHANIMIQDGLYKDVLIHLIIQLPQDYPRSPPSATIAPGHPFNTKFHAHIFGNNQYGSEICTDLLRSYQEHFRSRSIYTEDGEAVVSGWSSVYTLSSVLMQLQVFFADPDLPPHKLPRQEAIQQMKEQTKTYTFKIKVKEGKTTNTVIHSYNNPYPPIICPNQQICDQKGINQQTSPIDKTVNNDKMLDNQFAKGSNNNNNMKQLIMEEETKTSGVNDDYSQVDVKSISSKEMRFEICNKLVCPITKKNIFNDEMPIFGYPLYVDRDNFKRLQTSPVIEIMSEEGIEFLINLEVENLGCFSRRFYSTYGVLFNFWLPLYINRRHYSKSRDQILHAITRLYFFMSRTRIPLSKQTFEPSMVLKVLPPILVKTVIEILKDDIHQSSAALDAYCQFYWLFMKLIFEYPELQQEIDQEVDRFVNEKEFRHKRKVGDLGEFMFKLSLSKYGVFNKDVNLALLTEFFTRQASWAKKNDKKLRENELLNLVERFIRGSSVACQFFLVQFETAKLMVNDLVRAQMEEEYGVLNPAMQNHFMKKMKWIRNNMTSDWRVLINGIGLRDILCSEQRVEEMLRVAFEEEEDTYSRWSTIQCSASKIQFVDASCPQFGYLISVSLGRFSLNAKLMSNFSHPVKILLEEAKTGINQNMYWLPIYINKEHFERVKSIYNAQITLFYLKNFKGENLKQVDIAKAAVQVFCTVLSASLGSYIDIVMASIQLLWSFWKLLEQNAKMRQYLNDTVQIFLEDQKRRRNYSWDELREFTTILTLSGKYGNDQNAWCTFLEEIIRRQIESSVGNKLNESTEFKCDDFGMHNPFHIKKIIVQIDLSSIVLDDNNRAELEDRNGFLKGPNIEKIRGYREYISKQHSSSLWESTLQVMNLKGKVRGYAGMSALIKKVLKEMVEEVKNPNTTFDKLGLKFAVKLNNKKK